MNYYNKEIFKRIVILNEQTIIKIYRVTYDVK